MYTLGISHPLGYSPWSRNNTILEALVHITVQYFYELVVICTLQPRLALHVSPQLPSNRRQMSVFIILCFEKRIA
jgi:hypothetical protein